eukprot:scaffold74906_cov22-Prasinocladus_malaysianus.AAC.1
MLELCDEGAVNMSNYQPKTVVKGDLEQFGSMTVYGKLEANFDGLVTATAIPLLPLQPSD